MHYRIYSDRRFVVEKRGWVELLFPFWGPSPELPEWRRLRRFDAWTSRGARHFTLVEHPRDADFCVLPSDWKGYLREDRVDLANAFVRTLHGAPLLVFFASDWDYPVPLEAHAVFRTTMVGSRRQRNEFALPGWSGDLLAAYRGGRVQPRRKAARPVVGFCGYARRSLPSRLKQVLWALGGRRHPVGFDPIALRAGALNILRRSRDLQTRFVVRDRYFDATVSAHGWNAKRGERARDQYVATILDSDYGVCVRGGGNYSYRFYETLACGRIPVFVDTDCVLPFDRTIDWKRYCVWCDAREIERLPEKILAFHARLSDAEFIELQYAARRLWEDRLSPEGFFSHFAESLTEP